jgi:hypothetical protein
MAISHASRFLKSNDQIAALLAEIERSASLLRAVRRALPPPSDTHCLHAGLHQGVLTLTCDSPTWAARLRFATPQVQTALRGSYGTITSCRVRVQPQYEARPRAEDRLQLSPKAVGHLRQAANDIDDPRIAAALRRLAQAGAGD